MSEYKASLSLLLPQAISEPDEEDEANKEDGVVDRDYIKLRAAKIGAKFAGQRARAPL
jgi:hypothetical protein